MAHLPTDPLFAAQWHLLNTGQLGGAERYDINVVPVWPEYTGEGVLVAVQDSGIDATHVDLVANYRPDLSWNVLIPSRDVAPAEDAHGTAVAGLISGAENGVGGVGVAYDSQFFMLSDVGARTPTADLAAVARYASGAARALEGGADVYNNSWGPMYSPFDQAPVQAQWWEIGRTLAADGRDGLGMVTVFAGGNDRGATAETTFNTNYDPSNNSPWVIQVAAAGDTGRIAEYSTPGASLLVSGPTAAAEGTVVTTDISGGAGYAAGDYADDFSGTSASAPIVAGVVALVLEANPDLGYRDVQEILASSARWLDSGSQGWASNGATDWNGGGHLVSHDYGFGGVDALAAVRLAETWTRQSTMTNLEQVGGAVQQGSGVLAAGGTLEATAVFAQPLRVEQVQVHVTLRDTDLHGLTIALVSPDGTESVLSDRAPMVNVAGGPLPDGSLASLDWTFNSTHHWGEDATGTWTLRIASADGATTAVLDQWSISAMGGAGGLDDTYVYTDDFARLAAADPARATLVDTAGINTLNAAAVTTDSVIDLSGGVGSLGGVDFAVGAGSAIATVYAGDGADRLIGSAAADGFHGGRGADALVGNAGADVLSGWQGTDALYGNTGADLLYGNLDADTLFGGQDADTLFGGQGDDDVFGGMGDDLLFGNWGDDELDGGAGADTLDGGMGLDSLRGGGGDDLLDGSFNNDALLGEEGADTLVGGSGWDLLHGGQGDDLVFGGYDGDLLYGGLGDDTLEGGDGNDLLYGGLGGSDLFVFGQVSGVDRVFEFDVDLDRLMIAANVNGSGLLDAAGLLAGRLGTSEEGNALIDLGDFAVPGLLGLVIPNTIELVGVRPDQVTAANIVIV